MGKDLKGKDLGEGISQRKDGLFVARFTHNGKRHQKYFDKLVDAKRWLKSARVEAEYTGRYADRCTVDEWYERWIENSKRGIVSDNTCKNYRNRYLINIKPVLGKLCLSDVKPDMCQRVLNIMEAEDYSYGTMNQTRITMHALFDGAVLSDYLQKNPVNKSVKCRVKDVEERRVLSVEEQQTFLEYAKDTMYFNAYKLVLLTGLRSGEVSGLQWKYVDFEKRELHVRHTMLFDKKKGGFYLGKPKTKRSIRTIPLNEAAIQVLKEQQVYQNRMKSKSNQWHDSDLVFTTINGVALGHSSYQLSIRRIVTNINNDRKYNAKMNGTDWTEFQPLYMHALRHTFATRCIESGMQPKVLQAILGHSTINVTMDLYVHATDEFIREEVEKIKYVV